ncbi:8-oxo-dGTP pyrophosphatase MutT (NUDIX family) [Albidovulum inexpectatum]|uniref:8-oxo-dGTP pyrophosphatase MutT (NUDIX family) n=1 Tax=Albidovulum inexpectatum TaxID=196587 RepID=A0A2S5JFL1_9RHOB|nr:NUDIX hydrolase [Albidovulum inexpectatum]PPB80210.1 8-oxo-dGTP pyrophosphatase MutT (NUDIX family) [Albidovulum inexpectatum]
MTEGAAQVSPSIRNAATIILLRRDGAAGPRVLMGRRGASAAFMPSKYVFPGGAVDPCDAQVPLADPLDPVCARRLAWRAAGASANAIAAAAIRELWEETGLILGQPGTWPHPAPPGWRGFADTGHLPSAGALRFVFRAITPPGRPRRFDARFFLADADHVAGNVDDFSRACDELSALAWVPLARARDLDLPFITEVVLAEIRAHLSRETQPGSVPFFDNSDAESRFIRIE